MCASNNTSNESTVSTTVVARGALRPTRRMAPNNVVIWVDAAIDSSNDDCKNALLLLQNVVSDVSLFTTPAECIEFLKKMENIKAFIISSESLGQQLVNNIHELSQVDVIYIFCGNKTHHEQWAKEWLKIRGVFTSIEPICESLKKVVHENDHDSIPMSFLSEQTIATTGKSKEKSLDQLDPMYMYSIIFKNIILDINDDDKQMDALVAHCREQKAPVQELNEFQRRYEQKSPIWWYTEEIFLYGMLNKALRNFHMKGMIKMGFFIRHLHLQLKELHEEQAANFKEQFIVYRGQGLSPEDFQNLLNTKGGLLSFNNFLSTSKMAHVTEEFVQRTMAKNAYTVGAIFVMTIDPKKTSISTTPYAMIDEHSAVPTEQEILFRMHTVFRVGEVKSIGKNNRSYEVQLTLEDDSDPELARLIDYIDGEIRSSSGWRRMGDLMLKMGDFEQAEELYNELLENASTDRGRSFIHHQLGWLKTDQGK